MIHLHASRDENKNCSFLFPFSFSSTADLLIIKEKWWWHYYCQHYRRDFVTPPAAVKIDVTEHFGSNVSLVMIPRSWTKPSRRMKNCWGLSCCLSNGLSWLLILGCLNLFLTTKLTGIVTHTTPSHAVTNATKSNAVSSSWPNCKSYITFTFQTTDEKPQKPEKHLFSHVNLAQGHWDQSRNFRIFEHVLTGPDFPALSQLYDVTLVTQSSLDKLHWLSQVGKTWSGPISLALFVPDIEFDFAAKFLHHLINCDDTLRSKLAVHLIYPIGDMQLFLALLI